MTKLAKCYWATLLALGHMSAYGATHYVWSASRTPVSPFTNWSTASHTIQGALDVCVSGDVVTVTNGLYLTGSSTNRLGQVSRIIIPAGVTVTSLAGATHTEIRGETNLQSPIRCAEVQQHAALIGFTLAEGMVIGTPGGNGNGGGVLCHDTGVVRDCIICGNTAEYGAGGGVYGGRIERCAIFGNVAMYGGGCASGSLMHCLVGRNHAIGRGGGIYYGSATNCWLVGNVADECGGGSFMANLVSCAVLENVANITGGGACNMDECWGGATTQDCLFLNNSAETGAGVFSGDVSGCLLLGNRPGDTGDLKTSAQVGNITVREELMRRWVGGTNSLPASGR